MAVIGHGVEICTTATRPASPSNGTLIFDTNTKQLLLWVDGVWVSPMANQSAGGKLSGTYPNPGFARQVGLELITPTSVSGASISNGITGFTASAAVTINGVFSNRYRNYKLFYNGFGNTTGVANVHFRYRTGGGANFSDNTYKRMWYYQQAAGFLTIAQNGGPNNVWQYVANLDVYWDMTIFNPNKNGQTGFLNHHACYGTADNLGGVTHSYQLANRVYSGLQIEPIGATMTGEIAIYGILDNNAII